MKQAPLRALRCLPRERTGMWSGVRAIVSLPSGKGRARRSRATWLLVCAGIRFGTTPTMVAATKYAGRHEPPLPTPRDPVCARWADPDRGDRRLGQMSEPLLRALARMRGLLIDEQVLVRAVATGRQ